MGLYPRSGAGVAGEDPLGAALRDGLDLALLPEHVDAVAREAAVHAHAVHQDGGRDHLVLRDLSVELLESRLVQEHGVVGLLLDLPLGPLLLLPLRRRHGGLRLLLVVFCSFGPMVTLWWCGTSSLPPSPH